jgi:hypothetical protein
LATFFPKVLVLGYLAQVEIVLTSVFTFLLFKFKLQVHQCAFPISMMTFLKAVAAELLK